MRSRCDSTTKHERSPMRKACSPWDSSPVDSEWHCCPVSKYDLLIKILNVDGGNRTPKDFSTWTWIMRVYQFHHIDIILFNYQSSFVMWWSIRSLGFSFAKKHYSLHLRSRFICSLLLRVFFTLRPTENPFRSCPLLERHLVFLVGRVPHRHNKNILQQPLNNMQYY